MPALACLQMHLRSTGVASTPTMKTTTPRKSLSAFKTILLASAWILLTGCAGTNFVRVPDSTLVLGQTSSDQIKASLGSPRQEGVITKNGQPITTFSYVYAQSMGGDAAADDVIPVRCQSFFFFNDKLVGYNFASSWKDDCTDFDSSKVSEVKKGVSTRSDVIGLLGAPSGKSIYPLVTKDGEDAVSYLYTQTTKTSLVIIKSYMKTLVVTFNQQGIVTDVEYTESGQK
jgi:outer membrane protein assembly factor BamE (lipoprotein component of BamABCDE complex)